MSFRPTREYLNTAVDNQRAVDQAQQACRYFKLRHELTSYHHTQLVMSWTQEWPLDWHEQSESYKAVATAEAFVKLEERYWRAIERNTSVRDWPHA